MNSKRSEPGHNDVIHLFGTDLPIVDKNDVEMARRHIGPPRTKLKKKLRQGTVVLTGQMCEKHPEFYELDQKKIAHAVSERIDAQIDKGFGGEGVYKAFGDGNQHGWAYVRRIVLNECIDELRSRGGLLAIDTMHLDALVAPDANDVDAGLDVDALVVALLSRLPKAERWLIHMHVKGGLTFAEIANLVGEQEVAIRGLFWRCRKKLRKCIREMLDNQGE